MENKVINWFADSDELETHTRKFTFIGQECGKLCFATDTTGKLSWPVKLSWPIKQVTDMLLLGEWKQYRFGNKLG